MKEMNPFLKRQLKSQMLRSMGKCEMWQCWCRFAVPGYCLAEFKVFNCEVVAVRRKEMVTFKERK